MTVPLIQFENVKKSYGSTHVLKGLNLSIFQGEITAVIGKSGTGKSVLLKHIIGLVEPDEGRVLIDGTPLNRMSRDKKKAFQQQMSYMFQDNALFDFMTIFENIALPLVENPKYDRNKIRDKVIFLMEQLGVTETWGKYPAQLSGGMKKRVALARALVTDPKVVLFDEPTTGLDPVRKNAVHNMITEYQRRFGFTAVIVSHDIPEIFEIAQRIAMLDEGVIRFEGSKEELYDSHSDNIMAFISGQEKTAK